MINRLCPLAERSLRQLRNSPRNHGHHGLPTRQRDADFPCALVCIIADLLSPAAVQVKPGAPVRIDGWGGEPLHGRVSRVDPAGFVKVSALGIEEQRVRTADPPEAWSALGHDFRVIVHITTWSSERSLVVPVGALFRRGEQWAIFVVEEGAARTKIVDIGQRNNRLAEVLSGVGAGDRVVLHPSDRVRDGVRVALRES